VTGGPSISVPNLLSNGFQFTVNGTPSQTYTIQYTYGFIDWITLLTTNSANATFNVTDTNITDPMRFYRVMVGAP
jgi:hypothetical protein